MSELYDRINNFCCLSAIRNRELFKDTDYKTVYDLVDDLSILRKQLEALEIIKERFVWLEDGKLYCGKMNDFYAPIEEEIEGKEEMELLKEVL